MGPGLSCAKLRCWDPEEVRIPVWLRASSQGFVRFLHDGLGERGCPLRKPGKTWIHIDFVLGWTTEQQRHNGQGEESWLFWKRGEYGDVSLSDGIVEYAKTHEELKGAFLTFQKDADQIYPGWKEKLGYTGESSVQAASFDWKKKA